MFEVNRKHTQGAKAQARGNSLSTPYPSSLRVDLHLLENNSLCKIGGGFGSGKGGEPSVLWGIRKCRMACFANVN